LGDLRLPDITSANISAFLLSVQAEGKSHGTVIKYYTILKSLFKMAYMNDEIPRNPMDKVERPKPRKDEARKMEVEAYTEEETAHILECLEKEPLKWRVLMELMIDTGIRRGECCGLKWSADAPPKPHTVYAEILCPVWHTGAAPTQTAAQLRQHRNHKRCRYCQRVGNSGTLRQSRHFENVHPRRSS